MKADVVAGDTGTVLQRTVKNAKTRAVIDLTLATVVLKWRIDGGTLVTRTMTVLDALGGLVSYQFATGELTAIPYGSVLLAEVEITDHGGKVLTSVQPIELRVRAKL